MTAGYPNSDNASAIGFGAQVGMYFKTNNGFKLVYLINHRYILMNLNLRTLI